MISLKRLILVLFAMVVFGSSPSWSQSNVVPNFVLIVTDNLGYGDVGCFGSQVNRTPELDRMAAEGIKLTSFYVGSSVCTPSRASFMTGCYPARVSMEISGTRRVVLQPVAQKGLAPSEVTIAEVLKQQGYATMCIGKWHLGDQPQFLPTRQGFDDWLGVPYSEDMIATTGPRLGEMWPPLPLVSGETVIEAPVDPNTLTKRYTEAAVKFIRNCKRNQTPFFLYLPHAVPGSSTEAFASNEFRQRSQSGTYGACVEELDWSMGEILRCLKEEGLDDDTLVAWTSDNGAFQGRRVEPYGQNLPLRGTGGSAYEGGFRVPCIVRWPNKILAGQSSDELVTSMDWLPTITRLAGAKLPSENKIDGKNAWSVLAGEGDAKSPHENFYYYHTTQLRAVRSGKWKLHLPVNTNASRPALKPRFTPLQLYDLERDMVEAENLADANPEIVDRLTKLAETARQELGDSGRPGTEQRPAGWMDNVVALRRPGLASGRWVPAGTLPLITNGAGLSAWDAKSTQGWSATSSVALNVDDAAQLKVATILGDAVVHNLANDDSGKTAAYLTSAAEYGDLQAHIEFQLAKGSNSGVYLMGRYEIQLFDSYGKPDADLTYSDCGGVYQRDKDSFLGVAPTTNAVLPPGEWQSLDVTFRAPRFDASGNKTSAAQFVKVSLNGKTIHENIECPAPTRSAVFTDEASRGPLVIQGDHGPVALRNVWVRAISPE